MYRQSISIVLPAYNEEENIHKAVSSIVEYVSKHFKNYEIIVVNDGSTDRTGEIVEILAKKNKRVKLTSFTRNRGLYGRTLRKGFEYARKNLIFYTDSDNQFDITDLAKMMPFINEYDIVAGYRRNRQDPLMRIFIAYIYNLIIRILFNLEIKDIDCSFKLYKRKVFEDIKLNSKTGFIDAEIFIKARKKGFKVTQVGVSHFPRTKGKTIYEIGRSKAFALVKPEVPISIFKEIKRLWPELQ